MLKHRTMRCTFRDGHILVYGRLNCDVLLECHRLVRWIVTLLATRDYIATALNATGWPGGSLRSLLHGTSIATALNATGLPGGSLRSLLQLLRT